MPCLCVTRLWNESTFPNAPKHAEDPGHAGGRLQVAHVGLEIVNGQVMLSLQRNVAFLLSETAGSELKLQGEDSLKALGKLFQ